MSNDNRGGRGNKSALPSKKKKGLAAAAARARQGLQRLLGQKVQPDNSVEARTAVRHFLTAMGGVSARLYPGWQQVLNDALSDCNLGFDDRRALFEMHPVDDYFYAAVVALEAAKLRGLYSDLEAAELLGEIGEQVDAKSNRTDRVVSDLVFLMIGRIEMGSGMERMKAPYDKAVKTILQQMGVHRIANTRPLLGDVAFRHILGEPLALGVPQWWKSFRAQFSIYWDEPEQVYLEDDEVIPTIAAPEPARRRPRRRAVAF